jgi:hypothetical protein
VGANLRLVSESPLVVQARRITLGDRTPVPVVLANLGSDRYQRDRDPPSQAGSLASDSERRPVLVVRWDYSQLHWHWHECKIVVLVCQLRWREQLGSSTSTASVV